MKDLQNKLEKVKPKKVTNELKTAELVKEDVKEKESVVTNEKGETFEEVMEKESIISEKVNLELSKPLTTKIVPEAEIFESGLSCNVCGNGMKEIKDDDNETQYECVSCGRKISQMKIRR